MFKLSNLVTALFGIIAALGTILGIGSLGNIDGTATRSGDQPSDQLADPANPDLDPTQAASPRDSIASLTDPNSPVQDSLSQSGNRQVGQNAINPADPASPEASATRETVQNPTADFFTQGEGAVLTEEPAPPVTPDEAIAVQLDPSPGVTAPATVPSPAPVAQAPEAEAAPAPAPQPVRAMW